MSDNTGRNTERPCGSGKKYKKCCLKLSVVPVDLAWRRLRHLERSLMDQHLIPYVMDLLPQEIINTAMAERLPNDLPKEILQGQLLTNLFMYWFIFNWIPESNFNLEDFLPNLPIAVQYLRDPLKFCLYHDQTVIKIV